MVSRGENGSNAVRLEGILVKRDPYFLRVGVIGGGVVWVKSDCER